MTWSDVGAVAGSLFAVLANVATVAGVGWAAYKYFWWRRSRDVDDAASLASQLFDLAAIDDEVAKLRAAVPTSIADRLVVEAVDKTLRALAAEAQSELEQLRAGEPSEAVQDSMTQTARSINTRCRQIMSRT